MAKCIFRVTTLSRMVIASYLTCGSHFYLSSISVNRQPATRSRFPQNVLLTIQQPTNIRKSSFEFCNEFLCASRLHNLLFASGSRINLWRRLPLSPFIPPFSPPVLVPVNPVFGVHARAYSFILIGVLNTMSNTRTGCLSSSFACLIVLAYFDGHLYVFTLRNASASLNIRLF